MVNTVTHSIFSKAVEHFHNNNLDEAFNFSLQAVNLDNQCFDYHYLCGIILFEKQKFSDSLTYLLNAFKINSNDSELINNIGACYVKNFDYSAALEFFELSTNLFGKNEDNLFNLAVTYFLQKNYELAIQFFDELLIINPFHVLALNYRGQCFTSLSRYDLARSDFITALSINNNCTDVLSAFAIYHSTLHNFTEARSHIDKAIHLDPSNLDFYSDKASILIHQKDFVGAVSLADFVLSHDSNHAHALAIKGFIYFFEKDYINSLNFYNRALDINPLNPDSLAFRSHIFLTIKEFDKSLSDLFSIKSISPDYKYLQGSIFSIRLSICDWINFDINKNNICSDLIKSNKSVIFPLDFIKFSDNLFLQLCCSKFFSENSFIPNPPIQPYSHKKIKLGYYSADFREHPVSYLISELLELHDRSKFEVYAFSLYSPDQNDPLKKRIESVVDHFYDVANISDDEIVALSRRLEIDIAIDLGGHTQFARTQIFASRVAPIQVNYLGYPGTMGASFMDYIIADRIVIPEENQIYFTEKVAYLNTCFQANDSKRKKSDKKFTRKDLGLPENGFVYCCFNQSHKITPEIFECWMEILREVEGSVLWLPDFSKSAKNNIFLSASKYGISNNRFVFAPLINSNSDHLSRLSLADLFLDTCPYNAHSSAIEAISNNLLLLTLQGQSFASRVASSILTSLDLTDLITKNKNEYIRVAVAIGQNAAYFSSLNIKLQSSLASSQFVSPMLFVNDFENLLSSLSIAHS